MTSHKPAPQFTLKALRIAILLALGYTALIFLLPANQASMQAYRLSPLEYRTILFMVMLPAMAAWLVAFVGYAKLRQYVYLVRKTSEGAQFGQLANGCAWLAWSLPLPAIVSLLLSAAANQWPGFYASSIIISNYVNLLLPFIAFSIIGGASRALVREAKLNFSLATIRVIMLLFVTAGVFYCYLTFRRFDLSSLTSTHNTYFLPIWLMVASIIIPYLYAWFVGLLAAYEITLFSKQTRGVLYRQSLRFLVAGLVTIIVSSIALQYMNSVQPRVGHLVISYRLVLESMFRVVGGCGFLLLAAGAARLKKIEEV